MGNLLKSSRSNLQETVTPYSLKAVDKASSTGTNFNWGDSGSKQHILNFLGSKLQNTGTTKRFIKSFNRQMNSNDINNIRNLFDIIQFTLGQTIEALRFYTIVQCGFGDIFIYEFARSKHLFGESSEVSVGPFVERHCKSALITHCFIVQNIENLLLVDEILNAIASSHVFLSKLSLAIKKYDEILYKFLKHEFYDYLPKATFLSLRKYFKIISARTQFLIEQKVQQKTTADMMEGMKFLRNILNKYHISNTSGAVKELYRCDSSQSYPQSIMTPFKSRTMSGITFESSNSMFSLI